MIKLKHTASLCVTLLCLFSWSEAAAVLPTVGWWGIGAGSSQSLCSSSTRHTAPRKLRPITVATVYSLKIISNDIILNLCILVFVFLILDSRGFKRSVMMHRFQRIVSLVVHNSCQFVSSVTLTVKDKDGNIFDFRDVPFQIELEIN